MRRALFPVAVLAVGAMSLTGCGDEDSGGGNTAAGGESGKVLRKASPATLHSVRAATPTQRDAARLGTPKKARLWARPGDDEGTPPAICDYADDVCTSLVAFGVGDYKDKEISTRQTQFEIYGYPSRGAARSAQQRYVAYNHSDEERDALRPRKIPVEGAESAKGFEMGPGGSLKGYSVIVQQGSYMADVEVRADDAKDLKGLKAVQKAAELQLAKITAADK